jgi:hypothetical protein
MAARYTDELTRGTTRWLVSNGVCSTRGSGS